VIDGVPPGMALTESDIQPQLTRRRPGQSKLTTPRDEKDIVRSPISRCHVNIKTYIFPTTQVTIMSGTEFGYTLGTPIALHVPNRNVRKRDYSEMLVIPRPGHADYTYQLKYGLRASSGGGRSSARETIGRVASGAIAEKWLRETYGTEIVCFVSSIGDVEIPAERVLNQKWSRSEVDQKGKLQILRGATSQGHSEWKRVQEDDDQIELDAKDEDCFVKAKDNVSEPAYRSLDSGIVYDRNGVEIGKDLDKKHDSVDVVAVRCPDASSACRMATLIRKVKSQKDSIGGVVTCVIRNVPVGLGEPCFDKLEAKLAHAMLSLPATKGFEIGSGFRGTRLRGSQHNDAFVKHKDGTPLLGLKTNNAGGTCDCSSVLCSSVVCSSVVCSSIH